MAELYIARSSSIASRTLGSEVMVMSSRDSTFFTLNEVAALIWEAADGTTPLSTIVNERVCREFEVDQETAAHDAQEFVDQLAKHGILIVSQQPIADRGAAPPA